MDPDQYEMIRRLDDFALYAGALVFGVVVVCVVAALVRAVRARMGGGE